jgi:hypothetical protein
VLVGDQQAGFLPLLACREPVSRLSLAVPPERRGQVRVCIESMWSTRSCSSGIEPSAG